MGLITIPVAHSATKLYNGNISETEWRTANTDNSLKWYKYYYYALNRITKAYGGTGTGDNGDKFNLGSSSIPTTYDLNGNITHLFRRGAIVSSPSLSNNNHFGSMDNLIYKYQGTSNKLQRIEENNGNDNYGFLDHSTASTEYTYDLNGNLKTDANKDITSITYNHLNLPTSIIFNGSSSQKIEYFYDANGVKLKKRVNDNGSIIETLYAGNFMYRGGSFDFYFHPEGYVSKENSNYKYVYQYKDHLGNIRVSYDNSGSVSSPNASIVEEKNYYPFGLQHRGYNKVHLAENNYWTYNGKELEDELGLDWTDYGARRYMTDLGRWASIDPLADKYYSLSPYNYVANNPINAIDPDGKRIIFVNGYLGAGSPHGGAAYWGGSNSDFVRGAQNFFSDRQTPFFTNYDHSYFRSGRNITRSDGYEYAKANYSTLTSGMNIEEDNFRFVTHSMGGAFSEGMMKYLREQGWRIDGVVHLNAWDPTSLNGEGYRDDYTITIDATITNDPVQILGRPLEDYGIPGADATIRKKSGKGISYRHRDLIDNDAFWTEYLPNALETNGDTKMNWGNSLNLIRSWLQENPDIILNVK